MSSLPVYQCHKQVRAAKITDIKTAYNVYNDRNESWFMLNTGHFVAIDADWLTRNPKLSVGGYYVEYDDGYTAYSPAEAFEKGYSLVVEEEQP